MPITIPAGVVPIRSLSTSDILNGERVTSYRWEVLTHSGGVDKLAGYLDGVVEPSATLSWSANAAVKGSGSLKVEDLQTAQQGYMRVADISLTANRLRPVLVVQGLPEIPLGVFLPSAAPEAWSGVGRILTIDLLDKCTVLDQDKVDSSYTVDTATPILSAIATVISSAGESITVDATVTATLSSPMVWVAGSSKLRIVNDLLAALNYNSLWVDGVGNFQATPYVVPAKRSLTYELLNLPRQLIDGSTSIYQDEWDRDRDIFGVPNKVIAVQNATGTATALIGTWTNTDPNSPFSYAARGNRWVVGEPLAVDTPADTDANVVIFLQSRAQASLIASSAVQATVKVKHLPVPLKVLDAMRFANVPAGIDKRHTVVTISLEASPLGLMTTELQEVIDL